MDGYADVSNAILFTGGRSLAINCLASPSKKNSNGIKTVSSMALVYLSKVLSLDSVALYQGIVVQANQKRMN